MKHNWTFIFGTWEQWTEHEVLLVYSIHRTVIEV